MWNLGMFLGVGIGGLGCFWMGFLVLWGFVVVGFWFWGFYLGMVVRDVRIWYKWWMIGLL